jgi:hypothetical protein
MLELASKLGWLASGLATDKTEITGDGGGPVRVEVTLALEKIYGEPLPGEVLADGHHVDVEEVGAADRGRPALPGASRGAP